MRAFPFNLLNSRVTKRSLCVLTSEHVRTMRSDLFEAKRLADAADPPNGVVHVEGTDAAEPLPTQAAGETAPDRVPVPELGAGAKEEGVPGSTPTVVISPVAGDKDPPRRLSQAETRMHQPQGYPLGYGLEQKILALRSVDFLEANGDGGGGGKWGGNEGYGGDDSSSVVDETAARYRKPRDEAEEERIWGVEGDGKTSKELEKTYWEGGEEEEEEEEEDRAGTEFYLSSYSRSPATANDEDHQGQHYSSARGWSSFDLFLPTAETDVDEKKAKGTRDAKVVPSLRDTDHPQPHFEQQDKEEEEEEEESDSNRSDRYRHFVPGEVEGRGASEFSFDSSKGDDLTFIHRDPDEGVEGEGASEDATARYELYSDTDVYFTVDTTEPWHQPKGRASDIDGPRGEVGHLSVLSVEGEIEGLSTLFGAEEASRDLFGDALPAPGVETPRKLFQKSTPDVVDE